MIRLHQQYTYSCLILLMISIELSKTKKCGENKCCSDFREINGLCTECIGFYGENCSTSCPSNFYGPRCRTVCNCSENEICNQFVGCISNYTCEDVGQHLELSQQDNLLWQIGIFSIAIQSLTLCLCVSNVLRKRMKWRRKLRMTNPRTVEDHIHEPERNSKMNRYKRKRVNGDAGPLDSSPTYGQVRNGYNHIHFPKVQFDGFFSDEYSSMKDQNLRHNGV